MRKKVGKWVLRIVGGILLLLVLLLLLLRLPYIQTKTAQFVTKRLSKQLNTTVRIDKVAMNFVDNASVKGIYVEDQEQDTLLFIREVNVDIAFFKIFKNIIEIDEATLNTGVIKVSENKDSIYNFQFIIDAFASTDTVTTPSESTITIDLDRIGLKNVRARADLLAGNHSLYFNDLNAKVDVFDLDAMSFKVGEINLDGLYADSVVKPTEAVEIVVDSVTGEIMFPLASLPLSLELRSLDINDAYLRMREEGYEPADTFDARYIELKQVELKMRDLAMDSSSLSGSLGELSLSLNDRFTLEEFTADFILDQEYAKLTDFTLKLPNSKAQLSASASYAQFADLQEMDEQLQIALDIPQADISLNDLRYFFAVEELEPFRNEILHLTGSLKGTVQNLLVNSLNLEVGNTLIAADGRLLNMLDMEGLGIRDFNLRGKADYEEYAIFLPNDTLKRHLREIGDISLQATAGGNLDSLNVENLEVYTESLAEAKFSGKLSDLLDMDLLSYDVRIHHITTGYQDAAIFVDSLPDMVRKFDTISYSGQAIGDLHDINLDGGFTTSLGDAEADIAIAFTSDYDDARYKGLLALDEFQLGELLENDSLGSISMKVKVDGSGLDTESLRTEIDGEISHLDYNNYSYQNINVDGVVDGLEFSGEANVDDENVRLDFLGSVNMNDSIPVMNFTLDLDTLNLKKLNLADSTLQIQLAIDADLKGLNPDDADGEVIVSGIKLKNDEMEWDTDTLSLVATRVDGDKGLYLNGEFISAAIEGDYQLSYLPDAILEFLDQYFPLKRFLGQSAKEDPILTSTEKRRVKNDVLAADIRLYEVEELAQFFSFPLERMDTVSLDFTLDLPNNLTEFEFLAPAVNYDGYYIEGVRAIASNNADLIKSNLSVDSVSLTESVHLGGVNMDMIFREQSAMIQALILNQKKEESLGFATRITTDDTTSFNIDFIRDFLLNNQTWNLNQASSVVVGSDGFTIPPINLNNGNEAFNISGSSQKIDLSFTDFNLNNFVEIVGIDSLNVTGLMNGDLQLGLDDETPISGDLVINDIMFNEFDIGNLNLDARKVGQDVTALFGIQGEEVSLEGDVEYDLSSSYMTGKVLVERLNLEPFNPLVSSYARDLLGSMQGYLAIDGQLTEPSISGALYFQEVEAFIVDLGTIYKIREGKVNVADGIIKPTVTLEDQATRLSYLQGEVTHDFFTDIRFNLDFNAEEFMFLNSEQNKTEYYYGTFVGKVDADITGTADLPIVDADITALQETDLTIQLLSSAAVLTQEDYMVFYDGNEIDTDDALDSISQKAYEPNSSIELNLKLSASDDAIFHVIVDPVTGDRLDIRGNTDLIVTIPSDGNLSIIGEYVVSEGRYRVSYENTIRRTFDLDAGSRLVFQGDPYNAGLDMRAIYSAEVSTQALVANSGAITGDGVSTRANVNVVLNVGGTLANPVLSFDIVIPDTAGGPVGDAVSNALAQLRQNETQLLEQVGSIILFNSFIGGSSGGNISNVGTATAVNSVGNLINTQLNKLASRTDGFEIDFDIDQYKDLSSEGQVTEFGIGLQQKLFNDRLIISAGGNANLETGQSTSNNFSSFAGDFVVQYLLTDSGRFRVKVFQKSDFDALSNSNVWKTGMGLSYKTKFGQIRPKE